MLLGFAEETFVMSKLYQKGFQVSIPYAGSTPYDIIAEKDGKLVKIQVKLLGKKKSDYFLYFLKNRERGEVYSKSEIDFFVGVHIKRDLSYIVPVEKIGSRKTAKVTFGEGSCWAEQFLEAWELLAG